MTLRGVAAATRGEWRKAMAQWHYRLLLVVCAIGPAVFAWVVRLQGLVPSDTLFGRYVDETGLATPLVVLGFAGLWGLPVIAAAAGGDLFASEDRHRTWIGTLTRSRSRAEVFAAKAIVAGGFAIAGVVLLGISAAIAGAALVGAGSLIDLSGRTLPAPEAALRIALAWISVLPPTLAIAAGAVFTSVATRSSVAGVGLPVCAALLLQLVSLIDASAWLRMLVPTAAFDAWHGLLADPPFLRPLVAGSAVNLGGAVALLVLAWRIFLRRDVV